MLSVAQLLDRSSNVWIHCSQSQKPEHIGELLSKVVADHDVVLSRTIANSTKHDSCSSLDVASACSSTGRNVRQSSFSGDSVSSIDHSNEPRAKYLLSDQSGRSLMKLYDYADAHQLKSATPMPIPMQTLRARIFDKHARTLLYAALTSLKDASPENAMMLRAIDKKSGEAQVAPFTTSEKFHQLSASRKKMIAARREADAKLKHCIKQTLSLKEQSDKIDALVIWDVPHRAFTKHAAFVKQQIRTGEVTVADLKAARGMHYDANDGSLSDSPHALQRANLENLAFSEEELRVLARHAQAA